MKERAVRTRTETPPPAAEAARCIEIRIRSKRAEKVTDAEFRFCETMWTTYPQWYSATASAVFHESKPLRSNASYPEAES